MPDNAHNQAQRVYYEQALDKAAMQVTGSPYIRRHAERMMRAADLQPGQRILEVGAGLGKFTMPMLEAGLDVTCLDLSPVMLERLEQSATEQGHSVKTVAADVADVGSHFGAEFDRVVGFFTLHHMVDLPNIFTAIRSVMKPGARLAFIEPMARNPLFYVQILLTPGTHWSAERGIVNMRGSVMSKSMRKAGLMPGDHESYGFFPPAIINRPLAPEVEDRMNEMSLLSFGRAFHVFHGAHVP
ncbi:MAG: methyltransferase domain-containing protein [Proteobacteria bacterium]|nr:methyltransferase domain-containing protein [Pseudomonadota bacterium]